jgi:ABC-type multidrug transport system fused ATPase/permease subunit/CRP-like cAMP-binding protein
MWALVADAHYAAQAEHKVLVEAAASSLAELRSASARVSTDALLARSQHLDLSAERAWSTAYACSALDDAVACLERFRAALLELLGGSVPEGVLGDAERPLHIHLTTGVSDLGAGGLFCSAPERVLVARSIESAEVVMTAVALANWTAPSLVLAVPALPIAVRDLCVQVGFVGTARTAICDMPGAAPLSQSALTAEAFAARDDAAVTATAQRSLWVEFLEALVARFGIKRLVKLARFTDQLDGPDFTPAAAAAALEAGAPMCFEGAQSFSQLLQDWASQQWESVALDTPTEWVGGIGSHVTFDPTDGKTEKPQLEVDAPVVPMTVLGCWRWMLHWLWTEKRTDLMWCVLAITWNCIWTVYGPVLLSDLIDETGFVAENGNADADALPHETSHGGLLPDFIITKHRTFIIALVACMAAGSAISVTLNRQLSIKTPCNPGFTLEIGSKLTQHISRLPQLFMDTANLPKLLNVMDEDIYLIGQAVSSSFTAVYCGLMLAASLGLMYTIERVLTSVLIGMLPLYGLIAATVGRQNGSMSMMYRREERGYKAFKEEVFFTSSVSRSLGQSAVLNGRLSGKAEDCLARADELSVHTATSQAMVASVSALFSTFLLGYGAWLMTSNRLSVGDWVAFYSAVQSALPLVPQLAEALRIWYGAQEALVLMRGIASLHREQFKNAAPLQTASIVLENVSFTFFPTPGPFVLVNVNAHCPSGSKIALCGRSGCGKSTLLRLLSRLYQPSSGRILVNGVCLNEVDIGSLISAVEQEVVLFNTSVKENIRISNPSASDEDVAAAAAAAAIAHDIEALHGGYNFPVGLRGKFLSGGQRQRIGFARALLRDAPVMLLDEPVAAQDSETLELLAKSVTSLRRRNGDAVTVISSSHSLAFFQHFDHALYVANRTVVEWGSIEELKARRGLLFQLFNAQEGMAVDSSGRVKLDAAKLRTVWLFASVAAEGLAKLASMFTTRKLRAGDVLYGVGDVQDTVYVVVSGRVEMREPPAAGAALGADGKPEKRVLRTLEPGAAFNAESLLHDVIPTHEACAESQTVLCACARVHFEQIMQLSPVVAAAVADMARRHAEYLAPASLRTAWPLCRVSDEDVALLADGAFRVDVVPAQTKLFSAPGSACSSLFVVLHGTVAVAKESGVEHVSAGSLFGATSLLEDINAEARPRLLHATTMDDSVIAVLTAEALAGVMKRTPSVKDAVRGMADAWLAARSATALSRMWLMAPLLAASSSKGDSMQPFRTLSAAVTTRLVGAGLLRNLTPTACVHGKLVATQRPPGVAPELRELQSGEWCAVELVLAGAASWTEEAEAEDSCVVTSLPAGMLSELAADFPGVEDTTLAMLAEYRAGLTSDALKALGLTGIDAEDLEMLPGFCSAHVLTPGKQVFDGRDAQPWIARVLWGDVRGSKGAVLKPGTTFCNQRAASLATGAPADAAAAAGGSDPSRAQLLAETAAPAPARRGSKQPPPRPPPPPPPMAVSMAPKAVVALFDVGALSGKIMEERRRRAAELRAAALARAMQLERIRGMRRDAMVLRLALEQGKLPEATHTADDRAASAGPRRRGLALFRCVAVRIGLACRLRSSATIVGTLDEAEVEAREQLTQVQAEYARRTAERESLVAQLRAAWEELEVAGSPHVPPLAAREFEATNASVTRANMALLHDALDAAQAARDARAAQIASVLDAANVMLADLGPEDDDDDGDDTAQEGHAAAAARLAAAGLQRTVQDEVLALCAALHAERNRRLALQGEARRELAEVREVLAAMRPAYDASDDELARLPTPQPTLVALRAHQEAVMRSRRSMAPDIARARDDLALLWAQLDIPTERRAPLLPAPGEAPSAALLQALQREVRHLNDAADIATHLMSTTPAKPADEPYRTVGGVLVGSVRIGGLRVRESDALLEEAATAQPTVDAIAAALYTRPEMARMRESAAAAEAE